MTARWVVDEVAPNRDLNVTWRPISLLLKNDPPADSPYYKGALGGHRLLRVMEAIRAELGDSAVFDWYWQCATRIHHDGDREFDISGVLEHMGYDAGVAAKFGAAADDEQWDRVIRAGMDDGLSLVGNDVGTPIIAFECADGTRRGIFGPVITKVPDTEQSLEFWDAMVVFTTTDGFWELKRTRTQSPEFGDRPAV